jgi:PTS system fructose-specific IIA component/PTS system nitrogen regulatory IIA component
LRALESISRHLRNDTFCRFLRQSATREQIVELLDEADQNQFAP